MEISTRPEKKIILNLVIVLTCLITSLHLTVHEYIPSASNFASSGHLYNGVLSSQAIGLFCVILCLLFTFLQLTEWVQIQWLPKVQLILLIIAAAALLLSVILDLIFQGDFAYTFVYIGTVLAIVDAAITMLDDYYPSEVIEE